MRPINLGDLEAGMTRQREKGGASPQALYELTNGYLDASNCPTARDGTSYDQRLPAGTKGLCSFGGKLHVFAMTPLTVANPLYVVDVLVHPDPAFAGSLVDIHFAKPFLGFLYVVAEFSDGSVWHYWLQKPHTWSASTVYGLNDTVIPTSANGLIYQAVTANTAPRWQPNTVYPVGSTVQPSTPNGFVYTITSSIGSAAASGPTEPVWPTQEGALVFEEVDSATVPASAAGTGSNTAGVPGSVLDRYGNSVQVP